MGYLDRKLTQLYYCVIKIIHFLHPVVDVSAQGSCTVIPINSTTLTATGGILPIGTENVMIQCNNCIDDDGRVLTNLRWYDPDGNKPPRLVISNYIPGAPHQIRVNGNRSNIILVIPTFNDSYDGNYTCGRNVFGDLPGPPTATISLTIGSELFVCSN